MKLFRKKRPVIDWVKKHRIASIVIVVVLFGILVTIGKQGKDVLNTNINTTKPVSMLSLTDIRASQVVATASGEVESLEQVTLSSEVFGTVARTYVDIGDTVKKGQRLVQFRAADKTAQRTQAQADYENALAAKQSLIAQIDAAYANHEKLVVSAANSVTAAESAVRTAENNLQQIAYTGSNALVDDAYEDLVFTLSAVENVMVSTLASADAIVGVDNKSGNDAFEDVLGALDMSTYTKATMQYGFARDKKNTYTSFIQGISSGTSHGRIDEAVAIAEASLATFQVLFSDLTALMERTVPIGELTKTQYDTFVSSVNAGRSSITAQQTALTNATQAIVTAKKSFSSQQITYEKAVQDLADTKVQAAADIAASEAGLKQLEAMMLSQDAGIKRALGVLAGVNAELAKTSIRSPISGTIADLPVKEGELVSNGAVVARVVNTSGLQVTAYIPSSVLSTIALGGLVEVDGKPVGSIARIAPSINPTTKKVEVIVSINDALRSTFIVGQFVDVDLLATPTEEDTAQAILVPFQAVRVSAEGHMVFIVEDGVVKGVPVETGTLVGDKIEITSDLSNITDIVSSVRGISVGDVVEVL